MLFTKFLIVLIVIVNNVKCVPLKNSRPAKNAIESDIGRITGSYDEVKTKRDGCCKASDMARKGCEAAKCALNAQNAVGSQMASRLRALIAEKAVLAANAAEAALVGQQAVVNEVQCAVKTAECNVNERCASVNQAQSLLTTATQTAQQATANHKLLVQAVQLACCLEKSAQCLFEKSKFTLQQQMHMLAEAKSRLAHLRERLQCACAECAQTKQAAQCACEAAKCAVGKTRRKKEIAPDRSQARLSDAKSQSH